MPHSGPISHATIHYPRFDTDCDTDSNPNAHLPHTGKNRLKGNPLCPTQPWVECIPHRVGKQVGCEHQGEHKNEGGG